MLMHRLQGSGSALVPGAWLDQGRQGLAGQPPGLEQISMERFQRRRGREGLKRSDRVNQRI